MITHSLLEKELKFDNNYMFIMLHYDQVKDCYFRLILDIEGFESENSLLNSDRFTEELEYAGILKKKNEGKYWIQKTENEAYIMQ